MDLKHNFYEENVSKYTMNDNFGHKVSYKVEQAGNYHGELRSNIKVVTSHCSNKIYLSGYPIVGNRLSGDDGGHMVPSCS